MKQKTISPKHLPKTTVNKPSPAQTLTRGLNILTTLQEGKYGLTAFSEKLNISMPTMYRLLKSLEMAGFVMRDPKDKGYCLGPMLVRMATDYWNIHQNLCICAKEEMFRLQYLSKETISLIVQMGIQGIVVDECASNEPFSFVGVKGRIEPLYCGAGNKVLLSQLPQDKLNLILKNLTFEPRAPKTILNKDDLIKEVEKARRQGYATSFEETVVGGAGISAPIKNYVCPVALTIVGPIDRFAPKLMDILEDLKKQH